MDTDKILITGAVGAGKSTLIRRLISNSGLAVSGFVTKRLPADETGFYPIHIHPASLPEKDRVYTAESLIGACNGKIHRVNLDVFNKLGTSFLKGVPGSVIVMDELGFLEAGAEAFTNAVFAALDGAIPVLAAVKARGDVPFLNRVRAYPGTRLFTVTPETREILYETLKPIVTNWK